MRAQRLALRVSFFKVKGLGALLRLCEPVVWAFQQKAVSWSWLESGVSGLGDTGHSRCEMKGVMGNTLEISQAKNGEERGLRLVKMKKERKLADENEQYLQTGWILWIFETKVVMGSRHSFLSHRKMSLWLSNFSGRLPAYSFPAFGWPGLADKLDDFLLRFLQISQNSLLITCSMYCGLCYY